MKQSIGPILRGTALGAFFGVLPGTGPAIASFASYMLEKKVAKDPSRFGHGAIEGVAGPEAANNADAQCKFIPMLTLGIPASGTMALMLGALMIHGITPGPTGDDRETRSLLGTDREHVDRQLDAARAQSASGRHMGEHAQGPLSPALPRHHGVFRHWHLQHEQCLVRCLSRGNLRYPRHPVDGARMQPDTPDARVCAGADDGGKPAAGIAGFRRRSHGFFHAADQPCVHHHHDLDPYRDGVTGCTEAPG